MDSLEIERQLFTLLMKRIEAEQPDDPEGVEVLLRVLRVRLEDVNRRIERRYLSFEEYSAMVKAVFDCGEMIEALQENHANELEGWYSSDTAETQAQWMLALLVDVRHDLESAAWEVEDSMPQLRVAFQRTRERLMIH